MTFAEKLRKLMKDRQLSQRRVAELTGINTSSISQYLAGRNEPYKERKRKMATALGVEETYFEDLVIGAAPPPPAPVNMTISLTARLMHKSKKFVAQGLQEGRFQWGYAVQTSPNKWTYFISPKKFSEYTGLEIQA